MPWEALTPLNTEMLSPKYANPIQLSSADVAAIQAQGKRTMVPISTAASVLEIWIGYGPQNERYINQFKMLCTNPCKAVLPLSPTYLFAQ